MPKIAKSIDIFIEISLVKKTVSKARNNKKNIKLHLYLVNEMGEGSERLKDYIRSVRILKNHLCSFSYWRCSLRLKFLSLFAVVDLFFNITIIFNIFNLKLSFFTPNWIRSRQILYSLTTHEHLFFNFRISANSFLVLWFSSIVLL